MAIFKVNQAALQAEQRSFSEAVSSFGDRYYEVAYEIGTELIDQLKERGNRSGWDQEVLDDLAVVANTRTGEIEIGLRPGSPHGRKLIENEYGTDTALPKPIFRTTMTAVTEELSQKLTDRLTEHFE